MKTLRCSTRLPRRAPEPPGVALDGASFSYLIVLALPGYILHQLFNESGGTAWRVKVAAAWAVFALLLLLLKKVPKSPRVSRQIAVLLLLAAVFGGLAFEFMRP